MAFYNNVIAGAAGAGSAGGATDYQISKSLRFNSSDSSYLSRTPSSASNRRTWTWSGWVKRSGIGTNDPIFEVAGSSTKATQFALKFHSNDYISIDYGGAFYLQTTRLFRDPSAWMHLVVVVDTTLSTADNRVRLYINGIEETVFTTRNNPNQNEDLAVNRTAAHAISASSNSLDGYLADVHFIDGQALAPTDFGEYDANNVWQAKKFTHGTAKHLGDWINDTVGTPYGSAVNGSDKAFDGNDSTGAAPNTGTAFVFTPSTPITGISKVRIRAVRDSSQSDDDGLQLNGTEIGSNWTAGAAVSEVEITVNNLTSLRWETNSISHWYKVYKIEIYYGGAYHTLVPGDINSFNLDFEDTTTNQALGYDASIDSPARNNRGGFDAVLYTGTGSDQTIKGLAFQPDLVWIKTRNEAENHFIVDSVRGVANQLYANSNGQEYTNANRFKAFNPNGFTVGTTDDTNQSSNSFVAWAWKAGGPSTSNTTGSITSSVSADNTYGFSVVSYTGATGAQTVGHGLSSAPKFIIAKNRDSSSDWIVYHEDLDSSYPEDKFLRLNQTNSTSTSADYWGSGGVTNSVFGVDNGILINSNSQKVIAYCWSEVSGYSKFDSYSGGTNPKTITTGFKPRFLLIKRTDTTNHWMLIDSKRGGTQKLGADTNVSENNNATLGDASQNIVEFLDDGFKLTTTNAGTNTSGGTYIYAAFGDRAGNNWTTNNLIATAGLDTAAQGFDVVTWTANGSNQSITGLGFQPDLIWAKSQNTGSTPHLLVDSVRGVSQVLSSHSTGAEQDYSGISGLISSFNSDGFDTGGNSDIATNNRSFVAWCWKAGGSASSNSNGSITSSVSANDTYGFSIVTYTGTGSNATVGHGLSSAPKWIVVKDRSQATGWAVYHDAIGTSTNNYIELQSAGAAGQDNTAFQNTAPTNSVFSIGTKAAVNSSGDNFVAYCWSEISGFSRFGSYTGTASSGNKVTTGFKTKFVLIKRVGNASDGETTYGGWGMYQEGETDKQLMANCSGEEGVRGNCNAGSNTRDIQASVVFNNDGFTLSSGWYEQNDTGVLYIYAAFADKPPGEIIDSLIDTPTNYEADSGNNGGNYCTLNPLDNATTLSNGNLTITGSSSSFKGVRSTIGMSSGKWYMECKVTAYSSSTSSAPGIWNGDDTSLNTGGGSYGNAYLFVTDYASNYRIYVNKGSSNPYSEAGSISAGDIIGIALDLDNGKCYVHINGTYLNSGNSVYSTWPADTYYFGGYEYTSGNQLDFNFGQRPFAYTPRTGHKSLCTTNLADPTIANGSTAMDAALYTGTGSTQTISGLGLSPDLVWIKRRSGAAIHVLNDALRGAGEQLSSNSSDGETTNTNNFAAFTSDGFTVGTGSGTNASPETHVAWAWDAGSSTVSNTNGSITSSVRANASAGFSITQYQGSGAADTIGHGLNASPSIVFFKPTSSAGDWFVYTDVIDGSLDYLKLNSVDAKNNSTWTDLLTSASVLEMEGSSTAINASGVTYIAYCFAPVEGYSAFGSYTGNGSTNGPFVYTGFRPKFLLYKRTDAADTVGWILTDSERNSYNVIDDYLATNTNSAEGTTNIVDFLSNGFKMRIGGADGNISAGNYVYACFAEHPFKTARAR